jgi:hypothetical protein
MWRSTGRKPDTFLYTNIITGAPCAPAWPCALMHNCILGTGNETLSHSLTDHRRLQAAHSKTRMETAGPALNLHTCLHALCARSCFLGGAACAEAGDATTAMAEYEKMRAEGCKLDRHVFSALIAALGGAVCGPDADRRMQLVLLERAFQLLDDMKVGLETKIGLVTWKLEGSLAWHV